LAYLGNRPAESFASFEKQVFTIVNSQTAYTLSHSVVNENDIRLVINNVVQEPGSGKAYTASGTTLTLSAALTNGTDTMYCVFLGRALQTVNAPNASVGSDQTAPTIITGQTAETSIATDDTILIHDTSASALRKMTRANFVSGIGGTNTPNFFAFLNANQTNFNDTSFTKVAYDAELFDTGNGFDTSTGTYTIPSTGKYFFGFQVRKSNIQTARLLLEIRINGSGERDFEHGTHGTYGAVTGSFIKSFSANDTVEAYLYQQSGATRTMRGGTNAKDSWMYGFKIIE
jgi:hypothetical protein